MNALQGYVLFSSDRGGMRIEFAKNKMGESSTTNGTNGTNLQLNNQIISVSSSSIYNFITFTCFIKLF